MDRDGITTSNRGMIMDWAKGRGGVPALLLQSGETDIDPDPVISFAADEVDERRQEVTWERFFEELEARRLAIKYRETNDDGTASTDYQLVNR